MRPFTPRNFATVAAFAGLVGLAAAALVQDGRAASSQDGSAETSPMMDHATPGHDAMPGMMQHHQQMMKGQGDHAAHMAGETPTLPGQDAFGAIQEIVRLLDADPKTDWSKVNLEALRQHLIDMNEVTLNAAAAAKPIDGGIEVAVTGIGRTVDAIRHIIPAHALEIDQTHLNGWSAKTGPLPNGVLLTVTSGDPKEVQHIRGLGFIGILVSGSHHQPHHLAMAKGEFSHGH